MEEFTDNQEITAGDINLIAMDLGAETFPDSEYAFADGTEYNVDRLNNITAAVVGSGIAIGYGNACRCTLSETTVLIDTGLIFFASGAKMRIEEPVSIAYENVFDTRYIYAYNDFSLNNIRIVNDAEKPSESADAVMLCTVTNGVLTDARAFAKAKVAVPVNHAPYRFQSSAYVSSTGEKPVGNVDNGQDYTAAAVKNVYYGHYVAVFLEDGETVECSYGLSHTCYLTKNGTNITITARKGGSGGGMDTFDIYFI